MKCYNLDEIKTRMRKDIEKAQALAEAWGKVTFPTKKDGSPFAIMQKNIDGAKYSQVSYAMQPGEYEATVYTSTPGCGYIHDSINLYELVRYLKDEKKIDKKENYQNKISCLEQVYTFDIEDIKEAVAARAEACREYAADLENQLSGIDSIYNSFKESFSAALKGLENETKKFSHKDAYYYIKDTVIERYPYC